MKTNVNLKEGPDNINSHPWIKFSFNRLIIIWREGEVRLKLDVQGQGGGRILDVDIHKAIPFERKTNQRGGSILIYEKTDLIYKVRKDLSISDKDKEILTIEIISKESKNMLLSCCYRPPKGITENLTAYLVSIFEEYKMRKRKVL